MIKIILLNIIWLITFLTAPTTSSLPDHHEHYFRKFPYMISPQPFITRQARDVREILNYRMKGDNKEGDHLSLNQPQIQIVDEENQNNLRSEYILPQNENMPHQMYQQINDMPQQHQNIIRRALETEKQQDNYPNNIEYQSDLTIQQQRQQPHQQNHIPLYSVPSQTYNHLQSIYQNQNQQNQPSHSLENNNDGYHRLTLSQRYLPPSTLQPPPTIPEQNLPKVSVPIPLAPTPIPMINITPRPPLLHKIYLPSASSPKPTKSVITNIYSYDSPADSEEDINETEPEVPVRQHYKILFIKAPTQVNRNAIRKAHAQHQNQHKTVVYVLSKKTDVTEIRDALQYLPTSTSKPEVHFIRYKTDDEAEHAKHQIQNHYHNLSDSTQYSSEGVPPISSAIGLARKSESQTTDNGYLPPGIQQNNDQEYLPPQPPAQEIQPSNAVNLPPSK